MQTEDRFSTFIVAHRGASAHAPENTLAAFRLAFEHGADGLEFDVRLARGCVPVVIHDADLRRTAARVEKVSAMRADELARVDVGSWFNRRFPKLAREEYAREGVPTLAQVLDLSRARAKVLYVELKCDDERETSALVASTIELLRRYEDLPARVIIESFHLHAILEAKRLMPKIKTAALFERTLRRPRFSFKDVICEAAAFRADELALHHSFITRRAVEVARENNFPIVAWTVDRADWARRAIQFGLRAVITNQPARLRRALDETIASGESHR